MTLFKKSPSQYYNISNEAELSSFSRKLTRLLRTKYTKERTLVILCIGTDRATGDSLGPVTGYKLNQLSLSKALICGSLNTPVHALNLENTLKIIQTHCRNPLIVAIDASLGSKEHIGHISLTEDALTPGLGVNKSLPSTGDISITGIVNSWSPVSTSLLQTTRLNTVVQLADSICQALSNAYHEVIENNV